MYHQTICTVLQYVNATVSVKLSKHLGHIKKNGKPEGTVNDLLSGTSDLILFPFFTRLWLYHYRIQSYPFYSSAIKILTPANHVDRITLIDFDMNVWLLFTIISFVSIATLKYVEKRSVSRAILEFVRILIMNSTFLSNPRSMRKRFLLIMIMTTATAINSVIQGHLKSVHISPENVPDIDSIEDLIRSNLTIYGWQSYKKMVWQKELWARYQRADSFLLESCIGKLQEGQRVACLLLNLYLMMYESKNIHASRDNWTDRSLVFLFAKDSPLINKFSSLLVKLSEAGFVSLFYNRDQDCFRRYRKYKSDRAINSLDLSNLVVSFYILSGGCLLGFFIFLCEVIISTTKVKLYLSVFT